jgi:chorismate synthase
MAGNSFGELFRVTTFGESHGPALGAVIDGCPPGLELSVADIQTQLDRRKPGQNRYTTARREADEVEILSGVFEGVTTGTPIGLLIRNTDQRSQDYSDIKDLFRPGHADYTYAHKYGRRDYRGGGRSSARETAMRVAAGAIAQKYLRLHFGVQFRAGVVQIGPHGTDEQQKGFDWNHVHENPFFCPDKYMAEAVADYLKELIKQGNSVGARVRLEVSHVPVGLGEPVFDRLEADLAKALMSINAVKAVGIGDGFAVAAQTGIQHRDELTPQGFRSNHAGGVLGGISTGQTLIAELAFKPTSSITSPGMTIDTAGQSAEIVTRGRHDPCVGIRGVPIAEAMAALVVMDHVLRQRAQNGGVHHDFPDICKL